MDCIFSGIEANLPLPAAHEGGCWYFRHPHLCLDFHHHQELELNLVTQGEAVYLLDDRKYALQRGSLVWLFPAQNHILLDRTPDFEMWILVVKPGLVERLGEKAEYRTLREENPAGSFCRRLEAERFHRLCVLLRELASLSEPAHLNSGLAYALLSAWTAYAAVSGEELSCQVHPAVEATARLLREDTEPTGLKQLASRFGLSASRLSTLFNEQTGVPLARYRNQQRLLRVLAVYRADPQSKTSLLEAALDAGFGSYAQFYRVFCKTMGCSPAAYLGKPEPVTLDKP